MQHQHKNQRGTIMVEVLAVLGLLGVMGTSIYRQVQRRNDELTNINIASEARTIKEATLAYIQAYRARFEEECVIPGGEDYYDFKFKNDDVAGIQDFLPDNWMGENLEDSILSEYEFYGTCYKLNGDSDRKGFYATIIPAPGTLPANFDFRRAARVAMLIGADGGVREGSGHEDTENPGTTIYSEKLIGTQGAWETDCPPKANCDTRDDDFFVVTTGMDTYIPEVEDIPDNAVSAPKSMAFERLHSTDYFSVGSQNKNCVKNYADFQFAHQTLTGGVPGTDTISEVEGTAEKKCDPLFWVGTKGSNGDNSEKGQVYVKNSLYVGRDNAGGSEGQGIHAVAIETGDNNSDRQITVHDTMGRNRLTLNGKGQIIGRSNSSTGSGYRLDAETGEIILFKEAEVTLGSDPDAPKGFVQVPTIRLKDGMLETNKEFTYANGTSTKKEKYRVDPAYTSLMNDIRLTSRGGAKLSDILPNYIAKNITTITNKDTVTKPTDCPAGYARALVVTPISWSQYVKSANLKIKTTSGDSSAATSHTHPIQFELKNNTLSGAELTTKSDDTESSLTLTQHKPVQIDIDSNWEVTLTYGGVTPGNNEAITAMAQTYCVFDKDTFKTATNEITDRVGYHQEAKSAPGGDDLPTASDRPCTNDYDCANTESCTGEVGKKICTKYGTCTEGNGEPTGETNFYCIGGEKAYVECLSDDMCTTDGDVCYNNRCKSATP